MNIKPKVEEARSFWSKVAKDNGWYVEPFYVQVWIDKDGKVLDSVSHRDMTRDYIISIIDFNKMSYQEKLDFISERNGYVEDNVGLDESGNEFRDDNGQALFLT